MYGRVPELATLERTGQGKYLGSKNRDNHRNQGKRRGIRKSALCGLTIRGTQTAAGNPKTQTSLQVQSEMGIGIGIKIFRTSHSRVKFTLEICVHAFCTGGHQSTTESGARRKEHGLPCPRNLKISHLFYVILFSCHLVNIALWPVLEIFQGAHVSLK